MAPDGTLFAASEVSCNSESTTQNGVVMEPRSDQSSNASQPYGQQPPPRIPAGVSNASDPSRDASRRDPGAAERGKQPQKSPGDFREQTAAKVEDVKAAAGQAIDQTKRKAAEYARTAKQRGIEIIDQQKHQVAEQLHTAGAAAHRAADKFREERDDNIAGYIDAVGDEVDRAASYLDQRNLQSLVRESQQFARREPEWFLGGMFLAGLAVTRFLKASGRGDKAYDRNTQTPQWQAGASPRPGAWSAEPSAGARMTQTDSTHADPSAEV